MAETGGRKKMEGWAQRCTPEFNKTEESGVLERERVREFRNIDQVRGEGGEGNTEDKGEYSNKYW